MHCGLEEYREALLKVKKLGWVYKESTEFTGSEEEHSGKEQSISKGVRGGAEHRAWASVPRWGQMAPPVQEVEGPGLVVATGREKGHV